MIRSILAMLLWAWLGSPLLAAPTGPVRLVYPPPGHSTSSQSIFFVGSVHPGSQLVVNGSAVALSKQGYFAPTFALKPGANTFTFRSRGVDGTSTLTRVVTRRPDITVPSDRPYLASLSPSGPQRIEPGTNVCLKARATPGGQLRANLAGEVISLVELSSTPVPAASALLGAFSPESATRGSYSGCLPARRGWQKVQAQLSLQWRGQTLTQMSPAEFTTLDPTRLNVIEVIVAEAIIRAGAGSEFARLTPLGRGVRSAVTSQNGDWLRLQGGGWIQQRDIRYLPAGTPLPRSAVRALSTRHTARASELIIPLEMPLPYTVRQEESRLVVTVWGAEAQTDLIRFEAGDPLIRSVQWELEGSEGVRFYIDLREPRQWGYQVRYEGPVLVVGVRSSPKRARGLADLTVMLDPGHGGTQTGSLGPTGIAEKTVNLQIALRLRDRLQKSGATVLMTRTDDRTVSLEARTRQLEAQTPTVFLSLHNNALPDGANPLKQYGTSVYWYHMQSRALAESLHHQLVRDLGRPDYGLYWDSLAVIRPTLAPAVLLELGFMIHPEEYLLLNTPTFQERISRAIVRGLEDWLQKQGA
ncbi:MAG: N-acetylmuramoyl-L-alanine amidase [Gemmatimonadaceae bacterium]|nr:N-acetylmuramoyl-L-alanine amidase [Gloeobacterales cyanobacterium ES-bin-141]